ncbi:MAG: dephospho-CoA kinase [Treponema sp.]|jgi:dephospho-CoA kinase|nr:dephospho-CoA kinase [Treponema sp.]
MGGKIIGLTGTYCAGKNHVAGLLERRGLAVLDVDKLGHRAIVEEKEAIVARFGTGMLGVAGDVDRRRLGARVFGRPAELAALEAIVHPAANRLTLQWIDAQGDKPCVVNAALLHRSCVFERLDAVILVKAPLLTRLLRAKRRDKLPWGALIRRFASQKGFISRYKNKNFLGTADRYVISNRGCPVFPSRLLERALERRIDEILEKEGILARGPLMIP